MTLMQSRAANPNFTKESVINAYYEMYGGDAALDKTAEMYMDEAFKTEESEKLIQEIRESEKIKFIITGLPDRISRYVTRR